MSKQVSGEMGWFLEYLKGELPDRKRRTPDFTYIRRQEIKGKDILLFVYGSLRKNFSLNEKLKNDKYLGPAISYSKEFQMFNLGHFPALTVTYPDELPADPFSKPAVVFGDIYSISSDTLLEIDNLESQGSLYSRLTRRFYLLKDNQLAGGQPKTRAHDLLRGVKITEALPCYVYVAYPGTSAHQIVKKQTLNAIEPRDDGIVYWEDGLVHSLLRGLKGQQLAEDESR